MATVATRISTVWHGLPLLSSLTKLRYMDPSTSSALRAGPSSCRTGSLSIGGDKRGGARGFDAHKRVKGRKRHILVDTLGLLVASRVKPTDTSDPRAGTSAAWGLSASFLRILTVIRVRQEGGGHAA